MFKRKNKQLGRNVGDRQSAPVFSYYQSRTRPDATTGRGETPVQRRQAPKRPLGKQVFVGIVLLAFLANLGLSTSASVVSTKPIDKSMLRSLSVYETGAQDVLGHSVFNYTKLTFNSAKFENEFAARFPEAGMVHVKVPFIGWSPEVELTPTNPAFILTTANGAFVVDERGLAVLPLKDLKSKLQQSLPTLNDEAGIDAQLGKAVLPKDDIIFITYLLQQLSTKQYHVQSLTLPRVPDELDVRLEGRGYTIKMNLAGDAAQQAGALIATLKKFDMDKTELKEYLDIRVEDRAYFK